MTVPGLSLRASCHIAPLFVKCSPCLLGALANRSCSDHFAFSKYSLNWMVSRPNFLDCESFDSMFQLYFAASDSSPSVDCLSDRHIMGEVVLLLGLLLLARPLRSLLKRKEVP